jgi:hypothetical protein
MLDQKVEFLDQKVEYVKSESYVVYVKLENWIC